jgi:hypothetical protein
VSELCRDILAVGREVASLRADIDRFRAELRTFVERFLADDRLQDIRTARSAVGDRAAAGLFARPVTRVEIPAKGFGAWRGGRIQ